MTFECSHEDDVLSAVNTGRWPERADAELRAHVEACEICRDLIAVATAISELDGAPVAVPDASRIWIAAQLRARADATRLAERPITVAQAIAFAAIVGMLGAVLGASLPWVHTAIASTKEALAHLDPRHIPVPLEFWTVVADHTGIAAAIVGCAMLMPVVLYWATREN
jgi:hypothetical protein